jgi:hypothetical protein
MDAVDWIIVIIGILFKLNDWFGKDKSDQSTSKTDDFDDDWEKEAEAKAQKTQTPLTLSELLIGLKTQMQSLDAYSRQSNRQQFASILLSLVREKVEQLEHLDKEQVSSQQLNQFQSWLTAIEELNVWLGSNAYLLHQKLAGDLLTPIYARRQGNHVFLTKALQSNLCIQQVMANAYKNHLHLHFIFNDQYFSVQPLIDLIRDEVQTFDQKIDIKNQMVWSQRKKEALLAAYWDAKNTQEALSAKRLKISKPYIEEKQVHWHIDQAFEFWTSELCVTAISFLLFERLYLEKLALDGEQEDAFIFDEKTFHSGIIPAFLKLDLIDVLCQKLRLNTDLLYEYMATEVNGNDPIYRLPNQKQGEAVGIPRQVFIKKLSAWVDLFLECQIVHFDGKKVKEMGIVSGISLSGETQLSLAQLVNQKLSNHEDLKKNAIFIFDEVLSMDVYELNTLKLDIQFSSQDRSKKKQQHQVKAVVEEAFEESVEEYVDEGAVAFKHFEHDPQKEINARDARDARDARERAAQEKDMYTIDTKIESMEDAELAQEMDHSYSYELESEQSARIAKETKKHGAKADKSTNQGFDGDFIFALSIPDFFDRKTRRRFNIESDKA